MLVATVCRVVNESAHIKRFLSHYSEISDVILLADGGSTDDTLELARKYRKVRIRHFSERVERNGIWRNPEGKHLNFMADWAAKAGADWIIMDDCDSAPNKELRSSRALRSLMKNELLDVIKVPRMYLWGTDKWFPELSGMHDPKRGDWTGLWAFRPNKIKWSEINPYANELTNPQLEGLNVERLQFPNALLHYFCLNEELVQRKLAFYRDSEQVPNMPHPLDSCGPVEDLPVWAELG